MGFEENLTVEGLLARQKELQFRYDSAQATYHASKTLYEERKATLVEFNNKYGRVIQMMQED